MLEVLHQGSQQDRWNPVVVVCHRFKKPLLLKTIEQVSATVSKAIILKQTHISHLMRHIQQVRTQETEQLILNG